ncbi:MAG TPA: type II toxin-antitoxin system mRNA interferase toxin, RelE/StbE family [Planktothrix sp. UBA8407]|jgi:addiction module toxin, RelE/StbE family|nr:type II toxin-antitoxin system mRNA interferase toxin, RelE/StbE family [Planktothrix sp. UBA8407]HBK21681.1 type II toxin-antitoxin system mRNA interferase toxin, RelE/StbE family [Planktothrix sp. UBA10369]
MKLVWSNGFKRGVKKLIKKNPQLQQKIIDVLKILAGDPFTSSLKSHKLTGNLDRLWACWVTYDCRIIFEFSEDQELAERVIFLIDIGSHDEVY